MPNLSWKPNEGDRLAILFGAGAAHSHNIADPALRPPLAQELMDVLLARAYPNATDRQQAFRDQWMPPGKPVPDLTFDHVWQGLIAPPEARERREGAVVVPSTKMMPNYYSCLHERLGRHRPIPKAYNILAEMLFACPSLECVATINFDELIDEAIDRVARSRHKILLRDYRIASTINQHRFLREGRYQGPVLQKLHGTLSDPYSIIAGVWKDPEGEIPDVYAPFLDSLARATHVLILGYSFSDHKLSTLAADVIRRSGNKEVYVVCAEQTEHVASLLQQDANPSVRIFEATSIYADDFLEALWSDLSRSAPPPDLSLRPEERAVLTRGPASLPVKNPTRFLSGSSRHASEGDLVFPDIVYDAIVLPGALRSVLAKLIDLGECQRLRRILQLSYVQFRYPSATHTRFAHSLGVAHLVNRLIALQREKGGNERGVSARDSVVPALGAVGPRNLLVAALLHDAGHGPSGHTLDSLQEYLPTGDRHDHEAAARGFLHAALERQGFADLKALLGEEGLAVVELSSIILGTHRLSPVISNGGLDLDRLDFILRDLLHSGLVINGQTASDYLAELRRHLDEVLLAFRLVPNAGPKEPQFYYQLTTNRAERNKCPVYTTLEKLGVAYCQLYERVYFCWQNSCAQAMVTCALERVLASRRFHLMDILPLVDEQLLDTLQTFDDAVVRELATLVKYRRLYDPVLLIRFSEPTKRFDARALARELNVLYPAGDKPALNWLVAFRPYKSFQVSFRDGDFFDPTPHDIKTAHFGTPARARLQVFAWPGLDFDPRVFRQQLADLMTGMGFPSAKYEIMNRPFD